MSRNYHKGIKGANSSDELQADDEHLKGAFVYFLASLDADSWFTLFAIADIPTTKNDFLRDDYIRTIVNMNNKIDNFLVLMN